MRKYVVLTIISALVISIVAIGCGSNESKPTPTPTQTPEETGQLPSNYKFSMTWNDSDGNSAAMQYWAKGDKWKTVWTSNAESENSDYVILYDGEYGYFYNPASNQVIKYVSENEMANPSALFAQQFQDDYYGNASPTAIIASKQAECPGGTSTDGQETVNGIPCIKFTCNFADGVSYTWISDGGWPVKIVTTTTLDSTTTTVQYSNVELNPTISDDIFDIDTVAPGVPITIIS